MGNLLTNEFWLNFTFWFNICIKPSTSLAQLSTMHIMEKYLRREAENLKMTQIAIETLMSRFAQLNDGNIIMVFIKSHIERFSILNAVISREKSSQSVYIRHISNVNLSNADK